MAPGSAGSKAPGLFSAIRIITLLGSILVALGSGTNYIYSAYAPQLGSRLNVSHTRLNIIGLAGNVGVYSSGPVWGRIVDLKGSRIPLIGAFVCLLFGYSGIKRMYDDGVGDGATVSTFHFAVLVACGFMTGLGGNAGLAASVNTTARSFPDTARATTTGLVLSGFGLSAFWFSTLASTFFPGDTSAFLLVLALGTSIPMLIGLFIVRPVPLPSKTDSHHQVPDVVDGYDPIPSGDAAVFIGDEELDAQADTEESSRAPLLAHGSEHSSYQVPEPSSAVEMHPARSLSRQRGDLPNIHGKQLWLTRDFYLLFTIMAILSGTGIMYINNVGSISQALYAKANPIYDDREALKWQSAQVSTVSIGNFAGRILIGLISDFTRIKLRLPRAYCLCIVSSLFVISQASAIGVASVTQLWMASALLGLAYGSLFGICPTIVIEWFGLAHLSENWGYASFAPLVGGNLFSLMFGRNLDAHAPNQDTRSSLPTATTSTPSTLLSFSTTHTVSSPIISTRELPSDHQCFDGRECYVTSLQVTMVACMFALGLSVWAGIRDGRRESVHKARRGSGSGRVV
ncbi:major facilitator superfamily domain-containing protein [Phlebopus sp. FC_14]|nr:major facilitator superfamily domain-containing protein [Phlebopus sp. FC_14]